MGNAWSIRPELRFFVTLIGRDACWEWPGMRDPCGYSRIGIDGKYVSGHRFAYELLVGEIPEGLEIDHLCRNRACVNPMHMEVVSHAENMARTKKGYGDLCPYGHVLEGENVYHRKDPGRAHSGSLICRKCVARRAREYKARKRLAGERG
jgi:hypothetical protein